MAEKKSQLEMLTDCLTSSLTPNEKHCEQLARILLEDGWKKDPCSVGDQIYWVHDSDDEQPAGIYTGVVEGTGYDRQKEFWFNAKYSNGLRYYHHENEIGVHLFFDQDQAEAELQKRL